MTAHRLPALHHERHAVVSDAFIPMYYKGDALVQGLVRTVDLVVWVDVLVPGPESRESVPPNTLIRQSLATQEQPRMLLKDELTPASHL